MPPRAVSASADARRQQAIDALLALAWEQDPGQIRTGEIAERIGISQPALYRHFPSKEALWCAALAHTFRCSDQQLEALGQAPDLSPLERVRAMLAGHAEQVSRQPGLARLLLHELQSPEPGPCRAEVERFLRRFRQRLGEQLRQVQLIAPAQPAGPAAADPDLLAEVLLALLQGLVLQGLLRGDLAALPQQLQAALPLLVSSLEDAP